MNHLLITEVARDEVAERLRAAERERLAHRANRRSRRQESRVASLAHAVRVALSDWRARTQLGAVSVPMCADDCVDATTP